MFRSGGLGGLVLLLAACGNPASSLVPQGVASLSPCDQAVVADAGHALPVGFPSSLALRTGWRLQSSAAVEGGGEVVSSPTFEPMGWCPARVPSTVVGALVEGGALADPLRGMDLRRLPGMGYAIGENFVTLEMPPDSPFRPGWWYRTTLAVDALAAGQHTWLRLDGVNYRAEVWVNGQRIDGGELQGTFRSFAVDLSAALVPHAVNGVAVKVFAPVPGDLAQTWVDWNPVPPDKDMGLWRKVSVGLTGQVALRHPLVRTRLNGDNTQARLTVEVEAENTATTPLPVTVHGALGTIEFSRALTLAPRSTQTVSFDAADTAALVLTNPPLWWPAQLGAPTLQHLSLEVSSEGVLSDRMELEVGLREVTSQINSSGAREFFVNGQRLFIRGAGWARDIFLRDTDERDHLQVELVKNLGLNAVRFEGTFGSDFLFDELDREGIVVLAGWSCCDAWQQSPDWDASDFAIAEASMRDMSRRLRAHPSVIDWMYGSDQPPSLDAEAMFLRVLDETHWPNPVQSSATGQPTPAGPTGMKMLGPYDWVSTTYWLTDTVAGGAWGFATEIGPGAAIPELPALRELLQADEVDPDASATWDFHCASLNLMNTHHFNAAVRARFGGWADLADFVRKAQVLNYEAERGMYEAYSQRMATSGGVIHWMLNSAWPSLLWHLFDHDLGTAGAYFGAKKGLEPVHVQYAPTDDAIFVVNNTRTQRPATVHLTWYTPEGTLLLESSTPVTAAPFSAVQVSVLPAVVARPALSFLFLELLDGGGAVLSSNAYWLASTRDPPNWEDERGPLADYSALTSLPQARVSLTTTDPAPGERQVRLTNTSAVPAFFVRLSLADAEGHELTPTFWSDDYLTLAPGQTRTLAVRWDAALPAPTLVISGWNLAP